MLRGVREIKKPHKGLIHGSLGGSGEIRTHGPFRAAGFQDRCNRPLCHTSCGRNCNLVLDPNWGSSGRHGKINVDLTPIKSNEHALGFDVGDDVGQAGLGFEVGHDKGFEAFGGGAHAGGVGVHHVEVGAHMGGQVGFVDDEEIAFGNAGAAFARDFFASCHIDHVDGEVGQFGAEGGGQVVAAAFYKYHVGVGKLFQHAVDGFEVDRGVFANGSMGAAACFNAHDAIGIQGTTDSEQALIFFGVDVVGDGHQVPLLAHAFA